MNESSKTITIQNLQHLLFTWTFFLNKLFHSSKTWKNETEEEEIEQAKALTFKEQEDEAEQH